MRLFRISMLTLVAVGAAAPAFADATLFLGSTTTPSHRAARGVALGVGLLIIGFEFEYSTTGEDAAESAPSLRTGMANVLVQSPLPIARLQPYVTIGGGGYRERLGTESQTSAVANAGFGVKISLAGPLRARVDYRMLRLAGTPLHARNHRIYAGVNLNF
jgi:hypothetical protein